MSAPNGKGARPSAAGASADPAPPAKRKKAGGRGGLATRTGNPNGSGQKGHKTRAGPPPPAKRKRLGGPGGSTSSSGGAGVSVPGGREGSETRLMPMDFLRKNC